MNYTFSCNRCEGHIGADETFVGEEVECPHCGEAITVPPHEGAAGKGELPPVPGSKADKARRRRKISMSAKIAWGSGLALLGLVVWHFTSPNTATNFSDADQSAEVSIDLGNFRTIEVNDQEYADYMNGYNNTGVAVAALATIEAEKDHWVKEVLKDGYGNLLAGVEDRERGLPQRYVRKK